VPEVELGQIAVQMRFADMEIVTDDSALEDGKEAFDLIGMERPAHEFFGTVTDRLMPEILAHMPILARVVGAKDRSLINLCDKAWARLAAVTLAECIELTCPPRSTSENTVSLSQFPPSHLIARLLL
jgi:hypothetical protein